MYENPAFGLVGGVRWCRWCESSALLLFLPFLPPRQYFVNDKPVRDFSYLAGAIMMVQDAQLSDSIRRDREREGGGGDTEREREREKRSICTNTHTNTYTNRSS